MIFPDLLQAMNSLYEVKLNTDFFELLNFRHLVTRIMTGYYGIIILMIYETYKILELRSSAKNLLLEWNGTDLVFVTWSGNG